MSSKSRKPNPMPTAEFVTVTPEMAELWLGKNVRNRNVRSGAVHMYTRDILSDNWHITGESIKFSVDEDLIDGQHRLRAIIAAQKAAILLVVRGITREAQDVMDSGAKRQAADALKLNGYTNAPLLAAASRVVIAMLDDDFTDTRNRSGKSATNTEIYDFVEENPGLSEACDQVGPWRKHLDISPSVLAVAAWRLNRIDTAATAQFFTAMAERSTDGKGDPRMTLLERFSAAAWDKERIHQDEQFSMIYRAWNAWRTDKKMRTIQPRDKEGNRIPAPEPK